MGEKKDYTKIIEYHYSGEYATKSPLVLTEENKKIVEVYDCHNDCYIDVSTKSINDLAKMLASIDADWRTITEEEYKKITNLNS